MLPLGLVEVAIAFLVTYVTTPLLIRSFQSHGVTGVDVHKPERPMRAEMCGLGAVIGFTVALLPLSLYFFDPQLLVVVLVALLAAAIGIVDDLFGLRQRHKVLLLLLAGAPLAYVLRDRTQLGPWFVGVLYPVFLVPLGVAGAGNLTNMLAGFNGLEAGLGVIALGGLALVSFLVGQSQSFLIALPMAAALAAFLLYNWYPARAFPGDTGTLAIGAVLACSVMVGKMEILGVWLLALHIADFVVKFLDGRGRSFEQRALFGDTTVAGDGVLHPPPYMALPHVLMNLAPMTETRLVKVLMVGEAVLVVVAIVFRGWLVG